ncbi:hypothetical protein Q5H92_20650 [Hymenobacter sp. M29]|uniref:Uncharacterized protein n=1 Tax=Hymenobacter mellowenesis TaxID=3063995 RepID=A0ABT9AFY5_9BACT|nr:hypothetical protein [Hymenobacter sp. M29]MDO7848787.1 hypothetical protein [Hymenobacter sp. M29]
MKLPTPTGLTLAQQAAGPALAITGGHALQVNWLLNLSGGTASNVYVVRAGSAALHLTVE